MAVPFILQKKQITILLTTNVHLQRNHICPERFAGDFCLFSRNGILLLPRQSQTPGLGIMLSQPPERRGSQALSTHSARCLPVASVYLGVMGMQAGFFLLQWLCLGQYSIQGIGCFLLGFQIHECKIFILLFLSTAILSVAFGL